MIHPSRGSVDVSAARSHDAVLLLCYLCTIKDQGTYVRSRYVPVRTVSTYHSRQKGSIVLKVLRTRMVYVEYVRDRAKRDTCTLCTNE